MKTIKEFLVKKHQTTQHNIRIAYLEKRKSYYLYLDFNNDLNTDDLHFFNNQIIPKIDSQIRQDIQDQFDDCCWYYNDPDTKKYTQAIGLKFSSPYDNEYTKFVYTNFKNGDLIDQLVFYTIQVEDLIKCIEDDWGQIKRYLTKA